MFLQVFAAVPGPKQLYQHSLLLSFYHTLLSKPDVSITKLAFECICAYKLPTVLPYKDNVKKLLEDKSLRDELLHFAIGNSELMILVFIFNI